MTQDSAILTIAVPTYNRAVKLEKQMEQLLPQLRPEVRVRVYDNASPDNTSEVMAKYLDRGIGYSRAATNCGAGRNIFRCFEECPTEWLWVLCDDDLAKPTAIADLLALLKTETADFVHTGSWQCPYSGDVMTSDLPGLLQNSNLSGIWWLTSGIYRVNSFRPLYRLYNESMSTWGPHVVMILSLAVKRGKIHLSPLQLTIPTSNAIAWSSLDALVRFSLVPEYINGPENQSLVAGRIYHEFFNEFMLCGLRETGDHPAIRRWYRIYRQARRNLKAYGAQSLTSQVMQNWHRPGSRKKTLQLVKLTISLQLMYWCPVWLFHFVARCSPLPPHIRTDYYGKRREYRAYG